MSKDLDELTKLNKDYVDSVQNCDVKRFNEILAQDFYCTNPDKSLVDRAAFLKQTAIPVKIKGLKAEDVRIRILGDDRLEKCVSTHCSMRICAACIHRNDCEHDCPRGNRERQIPYHISSRAAP